MNWITNVHDKCTQTLTLFLKCRASLEMESKKKNEIQLIIPLSENYEYLTMQLN